MRARIAHSCAHCALGFARPYCMSGRTYITHGHTSKFYGYIHSCEIHTTAVRVLVVITGNCEGSTSPDRGALNGSAPTCSIHSRHECSLQHVRL